MRWEFHGVTVEGQWDDARIGDRWQASFASRPLTQRAPDLRFHLALAAEVPRAPAAAPEFRQGELLAYYLRAAQVIAHFPRFGQLSLDLAHGVTRGSMVPAALHTHGVFEDLVAIGLAPHLRRRAMFLIHAFGASPPPRASPRTDNSALPPCALLVGDIGAGKTTTGLALLRVGWRLLSNDSPILTRHPQAGVRVLAYPGLLSAHPETLARFPELRHLNAGPPSDQKILFGAESVYPGAWLEAARATGTFFLSVGPGPDHTLERLPAPEALRLLLPHAIEQWDREMIPDHLALLNALIQGAPAYRLRLGPDMSTLSGLIASLM